MNATRRAVIVGRGLPERGGISAFIHGLAAHQHSGWKFELVNLTSDENMGGGGTISRGNATRTLRDLRRVRQAGAAGDLVHIHSALAPAPTLIRAGLLARAARGAGCRVVVHAHGGKVVSWADGAWQRRLLGIALSNVDAVIAVSDGVAETLRNVLGDRVRHVPNGVNVERFTPPKTPPSAPQILYVGILTERKGVLDLVRASEHLADRGVSHEVLIAGGRPDEGDEEHQRILRAIADSTAPIRLLGAFGHDEMPQVYREAMIFCLPSWWEAMPLSVLEAMATGVPVVATDVGDIGRSLGDVAGRVAPLRDPASLADALEFYLSDPNARERAGRAGRQRAVEEFSIVSTHDEVIRCYEELYR